MNFKYRYVPFGTNFLAHAGTRIDGQAEEAWLFENELVVDVGGVSWGYANEERSILDHHFFRTEGQYPSAAAAVLHQAHRICERFQHLRDSETHFWLVTHKSPDFDAFCSMYLAAGSFERQCSCRRLARPWPASRRLVADQEMDRLVQTEFDYYPERAQDAGAPRGDGGLC